MNPINDTAQLTALFAMIASQLPILIVSVLGCLAAGARRNELGRAVSWALMGFGLSVVLCVLIPIAQILAQNWVTESGHSVAQRAWLFTVLAVVWSLLRAASYGMLLMAILAGRMAPRNP
jgi:hypothetical protein